MSDTTQYDLANTLLDFLVLAAADIDSPCLIEKSYVAASRPALDRCNSLVVWSPGIGFSDVPNRDAGIDIATCSGSTYVGLSWRLGVCINTADSDGITEAEHDTDADCFYTLGFGLWRRLVIELGDGAVFGGDCRVTSLGSFEMEGDRSGGVVSGTHSMRVQVELTRPDTSS